MWINSQLERTRNETEVQKYCKVCVQIYLSDLWLDFIYVTYQGTNFLTDHKRIPNFFLCLLILTKCIFSLSQALENREYI